MEAKIGAIKALRERTGAGIMDCKRALEEVGGNQEKAEEILRQKGIADAAKKAGKGVREGLVDAYIHSGNRIGALVELNCETDFVARTPEFKELVHNLALQVAAMAPLYVDRGDMPEGEETDPEEVCLLQQTYIKDPSKVVQDLINDVVARVGENVRVRRFTRFALGE